MTKKAFTVSYILLNFSITVKLQKKNKSSLTTCSGRDCKGSNDLKPAQSFATNNPALVIPNQGSGYQKIRTVGRRSDQP